MHTYPSNQIERAAEQIVEIVHSSSGGCSAVARMHIECALTVLQHTADGKMAGALAAWRARKVVRFIDSTLEQPIRVQDLARLAGLSAGQFSRSFHVRFGVTARRYLAVRRMEFAKNQLLTTDLPLVEIALRCGMSDQSHFAKTFRRVVGTSPRQWRNAHRD
jgi:AraC family transcriptional regulator